MVLLIAVKHKQAVQHTSLYKRHVAMQLTSYIQDIMEEWARWIMSSVLKTDVGREFHSGFESHLFLQKFRSVLRLAPQTCWKHVVTTR